MITVDCSNAHNFPTTRALLAGRGSAPHQGIHAPTSPVNGGKRGGMGSYFPRKCWKVTASWVPSACLLCSLPLCYNPQGLHGTDSATVPEKMSSRRLSSSCPGAQLLQLAANYPTTLFPLRALTVSPAMNISGKKCFQEQKTRCSR